MRIRHFYHLAADFAWPEPLAAHVAAVRAAGLPGEVTVVVSGRPGNCATARDWLADRWPEAAVTGAGPGYEDVTLALARDWAHDHPGGAVLYAHAKGSYRPAPFSDAWRESMTIDVVGGWRACIAALASGRYDVAGPHWLDPELFPQMRTAAQENGGSTTPYFGGNFWWAAAGYLAALPPPGHRTRWDAERWIGLGTPRACDVRPGWPNLMAFAGPSAARLLDEEPG